MRIPDGLREIRVAPMQDASMTETETGTIEFRGYAAVYDAPSEDMGFREINAAGAFDRVLATNPDVRMLGMNHDLNHVLARTKSGTLTLASDERGLLTHAPDLASTPTVLELRSMVLRGDVDAMSYGFAAAASVWDESDPARITRTITDYAGLYDVSPVTFPAFTQTEASFRALVLDGLKSGEINPEELRGLLEAAEARDAPTGADVPESTEYQAAARRRSITLRLKRLAA